jgi:HAD superfamily hydrolase (TIGR01484 family)
MKKIIASDFDSTFCRNGEILQSDVDTVQRWRAAGNLFGFSTGRYFGSIRKKAKDMPVDFFISSGGAAVYDGNGELIWERYYDVDTLLEALEIEQNYDVAYIDVTYGTKAWELRSRRVNNPFPNNIERIHHAAFSCASPEIAQALTKDFNENLGEIVHAQYNYMNVDLVCPGVTKSTGIRALLEAVGVEERNVITIGDHLNDFEMIRDFHGCAVENAFPPIKEIARKLYSNFTDLVNDHIDLEVLSHEDNSK